MLKELRKTVKCPVRTNEPLAGHTSFRIGGPARYFVKAANSRELEKLIRTISLKSMDYFVIGSGTNVLIPDDGIKGIVIKLSGEFSRIKINSSCVVAGSAVKNAVLLKKTLNKSLGGIEFLSGIPGTLGGAVATNAGTAEGTIGNVIDWVELVDSAGRTKIIAGEKIIFSYRKSGIPLNAVITRVGLRLRKSKKSAILSKTRSIAARRRKTQPLASKNAGSFFKNPPGRLKAGQLIEKAGLKGTAVGGAEVSAKHANFIINKGSATSRDVMLLAKLIRGRVKKLYGVKLEPEVRFPGKRRIN